MEEGRPGRRGVLILVFALLLGATLRFADLDRQSLWLDEAASASFAESATFWECWFAEAQHPPLYRAMLFGAVRVLGSSETGLRFLPALFGVMAILAGWLLAREVKSRAAPVYAVLLAVSPYLVAYSRECRNYSLLILLALLATWAFVRFRRTGRGLFLYMLLSALLLMTHYFGALVLLGHEVVYWSKCRRSRAEWIRYRAFAALLLLPWLLWLFDHLAMQDRSWLGSPLRTAPLVPVRFLLGFGVAVSQASRISQPVSEVLAEEGPVLVLLLPPLLWFVVRGAIAERGIALLLAVGPFVLLLALSPLLHLLSERYLSFCAPFLLLLVAVGLVETGCGKRVGWILAPVLLFCLVAQFRPTDRLFGYRLRYGKENWRAAAAWVEGLRPSDVRLVPDYLHLAFDRYYEAQDGPPPRLDLEVVVISHVDAETERELRSRNRERLLTERYFPAHSGIRVLVYLHPR